MEQFSWEKLIEKCLLEGNEEDWRRLKKEMDRDSSLLEEWIRFSKITESDLQPDEKKVWENLCRYRQAKEKQKRRRLYYRLSSVAAIVILLISIIWLYLLRNESDPYVMEPTTLAAGTSRGVLLLHDKTQISLSKIGKDTIIYHDGLEIRIDSSLSFSYTQSADTESSEIYYNTIIVPYAGEYRVTLSDNSVIYLNSGSELRFPTEFTPEERRVILKGEGYFDISKRDEQPFVVETEKMTVKVLGTSFNVQAYNPKKEIRTTLVEGKVKIYNRCDDSTMELSPSQQAILTPEGFSIKEVDTHMYTSWIDGKFYFKSTTLEEIAAQLERWYDIRIHFNNDNIKKEEFTGVISKDRPADIVFTMIEKATNVKFEIKGRDVTVY